MKRILILTILALFAGADLSAALSNAGGIPNWKAQKDDNGDVVLKTLSVNPSGTPGTGPGIITAFTPTVYVNVLSVPTPTPGIPAVSPTVSTNWKASGTLTVTTHTSQCLNLTSAAGVNGYLNFHARAIRGGTSVPADAVIGVTYSALVEALNGPMEFVTGASDKIYGPCFEPGTIIPMKASGTASVTLGYMLTQCK